jgi:hypothetical protein
VVCRILIFSFCIFAIIVGAFDEAPKHTRKVCNEALTRVLQSSEEKLEDVLESSNKKPRLDSVSIQDSKDTKSNAGKTSSGTTDKINTSKASSGTTDKDFVTYTSRNDDVAVVSRI